jgi:hypothetical protein
MDIDIIAGADLAALGKGAFGGLRLLFRGIEIPAAEVAGVLGRLGLS